jgi:uncharacterized protein involved in exopolysaccharide biosynthesis
MTWIDRLLALARWKRLIVINTLVVAVLSVGYALLLDNWYRSTASIFPPEEESFGLGSLSSLIAVSALGAGRSGVPVWASPSDVYASILGSRVVTEAIIERFDLQEVYDIEALDSAIRALRGNVEIHVAGDGVIYVSVDDKDPQRAADMANAYVEELDAVNRTKRHTAAGQARAFLDRRIAQANLDLRKAEEELRGLQEESGLLDPEEQVRAAVRALTELESQLILEEVELDLLEARLGPAHPQRGALQREVEELRAKVRELEEGTPGPRTDEDRIALRELPDLALAHFRALREVKVQETISEFLRQQFEQYRIQEERDTPTIYVLDPARPADRKHHPKRSILCASATLLAFGASLGFALVCEALARLRGTQPETFARVHLLAREVGLGKLLDRIPER